MATSDDSIVTSSTPPEISHHNDLKHWLFITIKLNGTNYLLRAQSFTKFVVSQKRKRGLNLLATMIG